MKSKVSDIRIVFIEPKNGLIAFASCVIDDKFSIGSIGIHKKLSKDEYRLTYAQKNGKTIAHPITRELSQEIERAIFSELKIVISQNRNDRHNSNSPCAE
jgi:DNA-binding cell septation regulator SpoVG